MWSDNVCGDLNDLSKQGFLTKTNKNMCDCVLCFSLIEKQSDRNLVRGRGKFNVCKEIISLQFTGHDTSHHIFGESQPKKLKSLFSCNKQRSRKFKHFTTASEIKSYREHPQKHKPQEMITQYACNKPALWPLNGRLSAAKMRFTQSKVRMLHALCSASNPCAREKRRKTSVQADSQGHVSPVSWAYDVLFGLSTLISNQILFHNLCEIEYPASGTLEHD